MTSEMIFRAIGQISDEKIAEANIKVIRTRPVRVAFVAAIVILILTFTSTVLAVSGIIDISSIVNSIFYNKEAAPYLQKGDGITMQSNDGEVSIEPIAAFFEPARSGMYLELQITDTIDTRLSDSLMFIDMTSSNNGSMINTGPVDVRFIDDSRIIAGLLISPVSTGDMLIRFDTIVSGIRRFNEAQTTQFSIGEHIGINSPVTVPGVEFVEITKITLDSELLTIDHRISDVAIHGWGSAILGLMKPDGEIIWSYSGAVGAGVRGQQDFFEIGNIDPNSLTLVWKGIRAENTIIGNWEFTVTGENIINPRSFSGEFEGHSVEVTLGATIVEITVFADYYSNEFPYDYYIDDAVTLLLKDGTSVHTRVEGIMCDITMASFAYGMRFVNPADVASVTFYGVTING